MTDKNFVLHLESKNHSPNTQKCYIRQVNHFLQWLGNDGTDCTKKEILQYLEYLKTKHNQQNITRRNSLIAINHYFDFLTSENITAFNPASLLKIRGTKKKMLYNTYTGEELEQLYDNFFHSFVRSFDDSHIPKNQRAQSFLSRNRNFIMLGMLIYQGLSTHELGLIELADLDTTKASVRIKATLKSAERKIPLKAAQTGALINYLQNIRPQFLSFCEENEKLFLALPESGKAQTSSQSIMGTIKLFTRQVRSINTSFVNFKQIRASVIANWLRSEGLRKTQYLAGHRHISSTEKYLPNELEGLSEDIARFNPFQ
ncbi:MAG: phage integrase N-terminal SAM-like domain-containing protein [Bacteroidales bacterium]|jgi:site-specific recombinase XerD|nr:phage integrase N-terminal SAM-like domain-containing protein [Bacteroidales bacterium]